MTMNDLDPHVLTTEREGLPEGCKGTHGWRNSKERRKRKNKSILKRKEEKWDLG